MISDKFNPVFGSWQLGRQIGSGTDGRVYRITRKDGEKTEKSIVKIIRFSHERLIGENEAVTNFPAFSKAEYCRAMIKNVTDNLDLVMKTDAGRFFAKCEEWETKPGSDGASTNLLIRMEPLTPLSEFINDFAFTETEVLRLALCLCQSLDKCRDFGYVYPNLKPENVMFDATGRCKLGDFGTFSLTQPKKNSIAYRKTQQYMAPEFLKEGRLGCASDTYSLGLIMYVLLNKGRLPFLSQGVNEPTLNEYTEAVAKRCAGEKIAPPLHASERVAKIVLRAVEYDEGARYITPRQMLGDIKKALAGEDPPEYEEPETAAPPVTESAYKQPELPTDLYEKYESDYALAMKNLEHRKQVRDEQWKIRANAITSAKPASRLTGSTPKKRIPITLIIT